jgi:hypothetical protein
MRELCVHLAKTSVDLLQVSYKGEVTSVLRRETDKERSKVANSNITLKEKKGRKLDGKMDGKHTIHFDKSNFKPIVHEKEPWIMNDYKRNSYCLYQSKEGSETETLQLIIGRTTIQIWQRIQDDDKRKDDLPNKGEPFLEYIWTNGIPIDQERDETRLRIKEFKRESNKDKLSDFYLKVYWYERINERNKNIAEEDHEINEMEKNENKEMKMIERKVKTIQWKDITEKVNAVRYACKALEHLNKRTRDLTNYVKIHRVSILITKFFFERNYY